MSGGKKKNNGTSLTTDPALETTLQPASVQPFMPGFDQAIANQLSAGYGQSPNAILEQLSQFYQPMNLPGMKSQPGYVFDPSAAVTKPNDKKKG